MADYDKKVVAPLLRRRAHLEENHADPAKLAELDHMLEMAGYPAEKDSSLDGHRVEKERPGVPRAEHENPPTDPPHDDNKTPRDDQAKADERADDAKVKTEQSGPPAEKVEGGKPDSKEVAEEKAGNTEGSAVPSKEDKSAERAKHTPPKERSAKPGNRSTTASKRSRAASDDDDDEENAAERATVEVKASVPVKGKDEKDKDVSGSGGLTLPKSDAKD